MTDFANRISDDAIAIVLAATHLGLGRGSSAKPLGPVGWNGVAAALHGAGLRPSWLLGRDATEIGDVLHYDPVEAERLAGLMQRAGSIAFDLERLAQRGIWVLTRADEAYPRRLTSRLGGNRPPVLFGAGPRSLLDAPSVAIVGSRDVDEAGTAFAAAVGERAARAGRSVVSGGARGVDRVAMNAALDIDGMAVGVLTDSLERWLRDPELRRAIGDERLVLLTPFKPDAGFTPANAMARNKLIYCLADHAVVIASDHGKGGTWAGATENLKGGWVPLFVRSEPDAPAGNRALLERGALPLTADDLEPGDSLVALLTERAAAAPGLDAVSRERDASVNTSAQLGFFEGGPVPPLDLHPTAKKPHRRKPSRPED